MGSNQKKCEGCGVTVSVYDLSQEDAEGRVEAPWLCLVCVYPEFYTYRLISG